MGQQRDDYLAVPMNVGGTHCRSTAQCGLGINSAGTVLGSVGYTDPATGNATGDGGGL